VAPWHFRGRAPTIPLVAKDARVETEPAESKRLRHIYTLSRGAVVAVFFWHGLVPKLIFRHPDEAVMLTDAGMTQKMADAGVLAAGVWEILLAVLLVVFWRSRLLLVAVILLMLAAVALVGWYSPYFLTAAFNPLTLNGCVVALAVIALLAWRPAPAPKQAPTMVTEPAPEPAPTSTP
jgi:uncharacterized membrane protein YphA (DoxX/SURF4 family)